MLSTDHSHATAEGVCCTRRVVEARRVTGGPPGTLVALDSGDWAEKKEVMFEIAATLMIGSNMSLITLTSRIENY